MASWAARGTLAKMVRGDDGRWLVSRAAVDLVLEEREAALERKRTRWWLITERPRAAVEARPSCEANTEAGQRCRRASAGCVGFGGWTTELCGAYRRQAERGDVDLEPVDQHAGGSP